MDHFNPANMARVADISATMPVFELPPGFDALKLKWPRVVTKLLNETILAVDEGKFFKVLKAPPKTKVKLSLFFLK